MGNLSSEEVLLAKTELFFSPSTHRRGCNFIIAKIPPRRPMLMLEQSASYNSLEYIFWLCNDKRGPCGCSVHTGRCRVLEKANIIPS